MRPTFLLRELVRRDLASRYRGSLLGFLWAFLTPLWQLALYSVVFSYILRVPLASEGTDKFPLFLFAGLIPWLGFSEGFMRSTTAVVEHANLVRKHRFPSEVLVVSAMIAATCHQALSAVLFGAFQAVSGGLDWSRILWLLPGLAIQMLLTLGLGWIAAAIQVYFRDVVQFAGIALSGGFYLTPIVYPSALVPERLRDLLLLNPLSTVVGAFRAALIGSSPPDARAWLAALVLSTSFAAAGLWIFRRLRPGFADEL